MDKTFVWTIVGNSAIAALGACLLTALARVIAPKLGLVDKPDGQRKLHKAPTPLMGGIAILGVFLGTILLNWIARTNGWTILVETNSFVSMLAVSSCLFCLLGLCDDKWALRPRNKVLGQIICSLPFVIWGRHIESIDFLGFEVHLGPLGYLVTIFWFVGCTNIINLVDGLDGLASSIGLIATLTVTTMAAMTGNHDVTLLSAIFAAALCGFLLHNRPPAKIFLGDAGSLMIGFVLGAFILEASIKTTAVFAVAIPMVIVSVPFFDAVTAIARRKLNGRGIGEADRGHIHHRLQNHGLTQPQTLLAIIGMCLTMSVCAIAATYLQSDWFAVGTCINLLGVLIVTRIFGYDETILFFRHLREFGLLLAESAGVLQTRFELARTPELDEAQSQKLWGHICRRAAEMGGTTLEFVCLEKSTNQPTNRLEWTAKNPLRSEGSRWSFQYEVERNGGIQATLSAHGSNSETANRQRLDDLFRLFDRFCREYPLNVTQTSETPIALPFPTANPPASTEENQNRAA